MKWKVFFVIFKGFSERAFKSKFDPDLNSFDFQQIKATEVKKLLKEIDIKKAVGVDAIPPKLVKISADIIAVPLTQAISCSLRQVSWTFFLKYTER